MLHLERVCLVHNFYQQPGGEDAVFAAESELLEARGIHVTRFTIHNDVVNTLSPLQVGAKTVWNPETRRELTAVLRTSRAQIVHFHNTFPLVSPSAYTAARDVGIPVVQTLHNFRLVCANALLFRDGAPCEDCLGRPVGWPGVVHACYRNSRLASATVAGMTAIHRGLGTWRNRVAAYIALTSFARDKFIAGGLPSDRIFVKPNFVANTAPAGEGAGEFALFVGRLSPEKGVNALMDAWRALGGRIPLKVAGDGPLSPLVRGIPGVEWLGQRSREEVSRLMREARLLVFPTLVYEGFPLVLAEAFAAGLPVVASNLGSSASIVRDGELGALFSPGDAAALRATVERYWSADAALTSMRRAARAEFEANYTADANFAVLMRIYEQALKNSRSAA